MKKLMTGNEALVQGAWEAGVLVASAYPGTPSTEIIENMSARKEVYSEWAPNEKVAMEAAIGASIAGVRSLAAMKHVGLNVAADPLFTFVYTGVNGGMVVVTADEPGQHSSQNEQDNRNYARAAMIPMMEPATSAEARDFMKEAYEISERFDTPVLMRMTTRACHSKGLVDCGDRVEKAPVKPYEKNAKKYVMVPANAKVRRVELTERLKKLEEFSEQTPLNFVEDNGSKVGVITSGMCYCFAKEVFGDDVNYLKLGFTYPLPQKKIAEFCKGLDTIYVIEENDPLIEAEVQRLGFEPKGKNTFPAYDELTSDVIRRCVHGEEFETIDYDKAKVVPRPPALCAGCPHRGFFYELGKRKNVMVTGDIGCYTLGFAEPYNAIDSCVCMGAAFSTGHIPHGCANAIYLPYVIQYNAKDSVAAKRYAEIARRMGLEGNSEKALINSLVAKIDEFNAKLNIPKTLKDFGINEEEFKEKIAKISELAVGDACTGSNPRAIDPAAMEKLFTCTYYGTEVDF